MRTNLLFASVIGLTGCAGGGEPAPPESEDLVDDLEDGDDAILLEAGRVGGWYTFNDGTSMTQTPPAAGFVPSPGGFDGSEYAATTTGNGFTMWGAGMGFDLNNPQAIGEPGERGTYDVSSYRGIAFAAKGNVSVRFSLATVALVSSMEGGDCTAGTMEGQECDDHYGANLALTGDWKEFQFDFEMLRQGGWGQRADLDLTKVMAVLFQVDPDLEFDVSVDDVRLYE